VAVALALALAAGSAGAAGTPAPEEGAWVRLRDQRVVELHAPRGEVPAAARARDATRALEAALAADRAAEATLEVQGEEALLRVGATVVLRLGPEDAAAEAQPVADLAGRAAASLRQALERERRRRQAHDVVYAISMVVFSGLVALLFVRWLGRAAEATANRVEAAGTRVPALSVGGVEVLSGPVVRGAAAFGLRLGRFAAQLGVVLAWALAALSQFEATLGARDLIGGALVAPLLGLGSRLAGGVPLLVGLALVAGLVALLAHAAGVYFDAVARGDAASPWISRELAPALGRLARAGIALAALLSVAAALGGDGLLGGLARAVVLGLGLAGAPLAGSALAGLPLLLGRVLRPGDVAELAGQRGRVVEVGVLAVVLEDEQGARVRVPHLASLVRPVRVERREPGAPR
jgi:hypothetical protein